MGNPAPISSEMPKEELSAADSQEVQQDMIVDTEGNTDVKKAQMEIESEKVNENVQKEEKQNKKSEAERPQSPEEEIPETSKIKSPEPQQNILDDEVEGEGNETVEAVEQQDMETEGEKAATDQEGMEAEESQPEPENNDTEEGMQLETTSNRMPDYFGAPRQTEEE